MAHEIKKVTFQKRLSKIALSPFIFPTLFLFFAILTVPIIYLTTQTPQDIRQRAATISSGPLAIDTSEISYEKATAEIVTQDSVSIIGLTSGLIILLIIMVAVIVYRRKVAMIV